VSGRPARAAPNDGRSRHGRRSQQEEAVEAQCRTPQAIGDRLLRTQHVQMTVDGKTGADLVHSTAVVGEQGSSESRAQPPIAEVRVADRRNDLQRGRQIASLGVKAHDVVQ